MEYILQTVDRMRKLCNKCVRHRVCEKQTGVLTDRAFSGHRSVII